MSVLRPQLIETATALLTSGAETAEWKEAGFANLMVAEAQGGIGGDWGDLQALLRLVAYHQPELHVLPLFVDPDSESAKIDTALAAAALIGGAVRRTLDMSIEHANTRVQFGKPIGKQQAVQQALAILAQEAAIISVANQAAALARDRGDAGFETGCAKLRANTAAARAISIAHQIHGAIGFTREFALQRFTAKLTEWRSLGGNDAYWLPRVGSYALREPGALLWTKLTRLDSPSS